MKCKHETTLAMENPKIIDESYLDHVTIEYEPRCEDCGKKLKKEEVTYIYKG